MRLPALILAAACAAAPAHATVTRDGGAFVIDVRRAGVAELAQRFAAASGSRIGAESLAWLERAAPRTLRWRGTRVEDGWRRLLGDATPYALACTTGAGCTVWVVGPPSARTSAPAPSTALRLARRGIEPAPAPVPTAPGTPAFEPPPEPDPPGLFPSD